MLSFTSVDFGYRRRVMVLSGFSFDFGTGATVLLGPNGAGKSTLLALGADVLRPRRGRVEMNGLPTGEWRSRAGYRRRVAWMPQRVQPIRGLTVREQASYVGWLKGVPAGQARANADRALERAGLASESDRRTTELSGGQLQRLGVAQALVHDADVVLMDEPTAGLDPQERQRFRELVASLRATSSVIVSTHQTEDIVDVYDAVVVLHRGAVQYTGAVADFLAHAPAGTPERHIASEAYAAVIGDR